MELQNPGEVLVLGFVLFGVVGLVLIVFNSNNNNDKPGVVANTCNPKWILGVQQPTKQSA